MATLLFLRTADGALAAFEEHLARYGLSYRKYNLLMSYPIRSDGASQTPPGLADRCGVRRGTITGLLDGPEATGLVARERQCADRRVVTVRLMSGGRALMDRLLPYQHPVASCEAVAPQPQVPL